MRSRDRHDTREDPLEPFADMEFADMEFADMEWPDPELGVDDEAFARAIAEGRGEELAA